MVQSLHSYLKPIMQYLMAGSANVFENQYLNEVLVLVLILTTIGNRASLDIHHFSCSHLSC